MRERYSISLDEDSIKAISSLSVQTGLTKSYIVGKYITEGLKSDLRLSSADRYFFGKIQIMDSIEMLFNSVGYMPKTNDICKNMMVLYCIPSVSFQSEKEFSFFQLSLFQIVDRIQQYDHILHKNIVDSLKKLNLRISKNSEISDDFQKSEETNLQRESEKIKKNRSTDIDAYKGIDVQEFEKSKSLRVDSSEDFKSSETSLLPARGTGILYNNTCDVLTQSSTTDMQSQKEQSEFLKNDMRKHIESENFDSMFWRQEK